MKKSAPPYRRDSGDFVIAIELNVDILGWSARHAAAEKYEAESGNDSPVLVSNSHFEFLGGVEREVAVEALEHEGEEMGPTGKTQIARERAQIIKEGLAAH